jgi:rSAM/selenodomain-associated transferase 1
MLLHESKVIVFHKALIPGQVKTRLASALGNEAALALYRAMVEDLVDNLKPLGQRLLFFEAASSAEGAIKLPFLESFERKRQQGIDLGERMYNALFQVLKGDAERAVLIGTDIPYVQASLIEKYFDELSRHGAVIGPAADGGYYLIGFRRDTLARAPFDNISWSSSSVFGQTLSKFREAGIDPGIGRELREWADLKKRR